MKTNLTRIFTLIATHAVTLLVSCKSPPPSQWRNYQQPGGYVNNGNVQQGVAYPGVQPQQLQNPHNIGGRRIVENGRAGRIMQKRHADGTPDGKPFWVPGGADPDTFNGLPVKHHSATRMSEDKLEQLLEQLNEPRR